MFMEQELKLLWIKIQVRPQEFSGTQAELGASPAQAERQHQLVPVSLPSVLLLSEGEKKTTSHTLETVPDWHIAGQNDR